MDLILDRDPGRYRESAGLVLMPARDRARRCYTVAIARERWDAIRRRDERGAVSQVEYLAHGGRWTTHEGRKVWRVDAG